MRQALRVSFGLALAFCALLTAPLAAQQGTITGRVTNSEDGAAVSSAEVHAVAAGRTVAQAITNTDGRYRLSVPAGTYDIHVESVGFEAMIQRGVRVAGGASVSRDITLAAAVFQLNPVVVSASKRTEKATEAPAHVDVVGPREIEARPTVTPVDHLRSTPGVDVLTSGVQSTNVVVRGFNNIFSGSLHALTDNRIASVPSLAVNFLHFISANDDDIQRMEVVLGPGAALYGPNTAHGVLHMITKSPLTDPGSTISVSGGTQNLMQVGVRSAQRLSDRFGIKVSGQYLKANEWEYVDPVEQAEKAKFASSPFFKADLMNALQITGPEADARIGRIGNRDFDVERIQGELRADWRATDDLTLVFQGGLTNVGKGIELTGLGAGQAVNWRYSYLQTRASMGRLFAQAYVNMSDAGDTYLLRNGTPIVDKSKMMVAQVQHGFAPMTWENLTYGVDLIRIVPNTNGSINGIYENDDETTEIGGYLQSETSLHDKLSLVLAGRLDDHSGLPEMIFSPRAGLVFKPSENQAFRVTYNRAFSTPSSLNQYLDLASAMPDANAARLGYSIRVQGTGTEGFTFGSAAGGYQMRSPFINAGKTMLAADATKAWAGAIAVVAQTAAAKGTPLPASLVTYLSGLTPNSTQIATTYLHPATGGTGALAALNLPDVAPIRESTTTTFEAGYRGALFNKFMLAVDVWREQLDNFVTPLTIQTPLLFHSGTQATAYITQALIPALTGMYMQAGMPQAQAQARAQAEAPVYGAQIGAGVAQVPVGVITSAQMDATGAQLLTTYYNNDDQINLNGVDFAGTYLLTGNVSVSGTLSLVNKDVFTAKRSGEKITLNAPKRKWGAAVAYRQPKIGFDTELRMRYNDEFPVRSGVYNGTACIGGAEPGHEDCVKSYTLFDVNASYQIPQVRGAAIQLYVQNLLDEDYRSYPGVPTIGRMALLRLKYNF